MTGLERLEREIVGCERCARLRAHCEEVARVKRRAYRDEEYWGKPVPGFGDERARLFIVGLAPGAHGANRTGRVFTGDKSGDWLYRALYEWGFASQAESVGRDDGMRLHETWIAAAVRCAPPDNKPLPAEMAACRPFLERELKLQTKVEVVVALGRIAFESYVSIVGARRGQFRFGHNELHGAVSGGPALISSYHPSQQNTSTGRLTAAMLSAVFERARGMLGPPLKTGKS